MSSGIRRIVSGELAQGKKKGSAFKSALQSAMSPQGLAGRSEGKSKVGK